MRGEVWGHMGKVMRSYQEAVHVCGHMHVHVHMHWSWLSWCLSLATYPWTSWSLFFLISFITIALVFWFCCPFSQASLPLIVQQRCLNSYSLHQGFSGLLIAQSVSWRFFGGWATCVLWLTWVPSFYSSAGPAWHCLQDHFKVFWLLNQSHERFFGGWATCVLRLTWVPSFYSAGPALMVALFTRPALMVAFNEVCAWSSWLGRGPDF